ncbi:hypothetical protein [Cytobacillus purgationiresistens]|uniref:Uncharacterized protein n=1 Tax=Cytobacillus purgationiresistens TaxID=863449 RepID=A0ABU0APK7_9BACI|nr:hypothetical protein [Cytobacillus purgationiresistens]MDQ0272313.1 hypothetical protein [Cytobacillus purgationiresistens]
MLLKNEQKAMLDEIWINFALLILFAAVFFVFAEDLKPSEE